MKGSLTDFKSSKSHAEGDIDYAQDLLNTITTNLGVTDDDVQNTGASDAIKSYIELEDKVNTGKETDWLKYAVLVVGWISNLYSLIILEFTFCYYLVSLCVLFLLLVCV